MAASTDVIIVGGGVVGCATAYFLSKRGVTATVLEKDSVGKHASGFAAGLLNPLHGHGIPGPLEALALESFRMHAHMGAEIYGETGIDPLSCSGTSVWVALDEAETTELSEIHRLSQRSEAFPARWLGGDEARSMEPRLSPAVVAALTVEGIREVAAYELTLGLFKAAEKHGASMRVSTVDGLTWHDGRVSGVRLATGEQLACDKVVLAMGPWTGQVERWLDLPVPVSPLKGQILRLEAPGPPLEHVFYRWGGGYIASKPDGLTWTGTTEEEVGFDDLPTPEARESIMSEACQVMPSLSQAKVALQTACLRPVSKDGLPIIGSVPGREGVYLATGAGRKGILLGPGMAMAIADLVTEGHTPIPIEPFSPDRFVATDQRTG